jgi:tripartite-type tricarboxylate transporter receptor subunit TctC
VGETIPGYEATAWFGVGMPRGTPPDIVNKMNAAINKVMSNPKIRERLAELGGVPITGTPADFGKIIQAETDKWAKVVKFSGATAE